MKKLLIPCCLLLLTNCVDNKYDKEIDMNVTMAENGISIPIGETDKFTLSKLISTDDNLKINGDSVYYISESTCSTTEFAAIQSSPSTKATVWLPISNRRRFYFPKKSF